VVAVLRGGSGKRSSFPVRQSNVQRRDSQNSRMLQWQPRAEPLRRARRREEGRSQPDGPCRRESPFVYGGKVRVLVRPVSCSRGDCTIVKVREDLRVLQIGVHSRKWGGHGNPQRSLFEKRTVVIRSIGITMLQFRPKSLFKSSWLTVLPCST
jgi:hypothetical protein